jgi:Uma2 family endonuclease
LIGGLIHYNACMATSSFSNIGAPTVVAVPPVATASMLLPPTPDGRVRFSREAYHRFGELGILPPDGRFELIDGEIYMMSPIGPPQGGIITRLMTSFVTRLPGHLSCRVQLPVAIGNDCEPEPDLAIVRCRDDDYMSALPTPADVALLVEVAESSLQFDLGPKLCLYAEAKIPEYWVVDVAHQSIFVHRQPAGNTFRIAQQVPPGNSIAPVAAPECQLEIAWLFH